MSDMRVHCNWFGRRAIAVDSLTGLLVPHRTKPGRKGKHCAGAGKLPTTRPERSVA